MFIYLFNCLLSYSSTRFSWACKKRIVLCHNCHTLSPSTNENPLSFHTRNKRGITPLACKA